MAKKIGTSKFKEKCLSILDRLDKDGITITKNGEPVEKLISIREDRNSYIGKFSNLIKVHGSTLSTGVKWDKKIRTSKLIPLA